MGLGAEQRPQSRLPQGGGNLFQEIKRISSDAEARGINLIRLSIGQLQGPALLSAREAASEAVMSSEESMHEYQDNDTPGVPGFARKFAQYHVGSELSRDGIDFLPIPGIKPMLEHIPTACGGDADNKINVLTTTKPGYPTPADWAKGIWKHNVSEPSLNPENQFRFSASDLTADTHLVMMNYPHNPSGQIATGEWLEEICSVAEKRGIRLFNDAAYIALSHDPETTSLADVAINFPNLSWIEAYSASKLIGNGTGWRVGAMVGSADFIGDMKTIKGKADSGLFAPAAVGVLNSIENDQEGIERARQTYQRRLEVLIDILQSNGMQIAVEPKAGFFSLWKSPAFAFGEPMTDAKQFNFKMIEETGLVGVHFDPYIRYAVTSDVEAYANQIDQAFKKAAVSY